MFNEIKESKWNLQWHDKTERNLLLCCMLLILMARVRLAWSWSEAQSGRTPNISDPGPDSRRSAVLLGPWQKKNSLQFYTEHNSSLHCILKLLLHLLFHTLTVGLYAAKFDDFIHSHILYFFLYLIATIHNIRVKPLKKLKKTIFKS